MTYSVERIVRIYNDSHGYCWQVGPDRDGLGNIEVLYSDDGVKFGESASMPPEVAALVAMALSEISARMAVEQQGAVGVAP